jgi:hypothetical protein
MVRLRVLFGAMLATGLMGLGLGVELGKRERPDEDAEARETVAAPACSVPVVPCVASMPNSSCSVPTLRVPKFTNRIRNDFLKQGKLCAEELTHAVIQAIEKGTQYKVVATADAADSELVGVITSFSQWCPGWNHNQINFIREPETTLVVDVVWKDLHTGKSLLTTKGNKRPFKSTVRSIAYYRPELSEPIAQARKQNVERMAEQILMLLEAAP